MLKLMMLINFKSSTASTLNRIKDSAKDHMSIVEAWTF